MEKEMQSVKVYTSDSEHIVISQTNESGVENLIVIHPDQVDAITKWLKEAKQETEDLQLPF